MENTNPKPALLSFLQIRHELLYVLLSTNKDRWNIVEAYLLIGAGAKHELSLNSRYSAISQLIQMNTLYKLFIQQILKHCQSAEMEMRGRVLGGRVRLHGHEVKEKRRK
jgi:hypothetical protein